MTFNEKLEEFMKKKEYKDLKQLSLDADIPYTTLRDFYLKHSADNSRLSTIRKLATFMNCSMDYLTYDDLIDSYQIKINESDLIYDEHKILEDQYNSKIYLQSNLKYLRTINGKTQEEFAKQLNKDYSTIGKWENGSRSPIIVDVIKMANLYNIYIEDLLNKDLKNQNNTISYNQYMSINKFIGSKIKEFRVKKNITQLELGEYLNTTSQTISRYENGERNTNPDILFILSNFFDISIDDFFPQKDLNISNIQEETMDKKDENYICTNIRYLRNLNKIKQGKMANDLNIDQSTIAKWETGDRQPNLGWISKICDYFHILIGDFITKDLRIKEDPIPNNQYNDEIKKIATDNGVEIHIAPNKELTAEDVLIVQQLLMEELKNNKDNK